MITNSTNRHSKYRWFLGGRPTKRTPEKVNSLVYKDYTLVENADGSKVYVSPEEKAQLLLEGKLKEPKLSVKNEKLRFSTRDSDSDSCYEIPVGKRKPKSCDNLNETPKHEMRRSGSYPFSGGEVSPGDNGIINLPPFMAPLETSFEEPIPKTKRRSKKFRKKNKNDTEEGEKSQESSSPDEIEPKTRASWTPEDEEVRKIIEGRERSASQTGGINLRRPSIEEEPKMMAKSADEINFKEVEGGLEAPVELFPLPSSRYSRGFSLPVFSADAVKERRTRFKKVDPNPLKKMFGMKGRKKEESDGESPLAEQPQPEWQTHPYQNAGRRYEDADLSAAQSDTESADHGSADKSSVTKLTNEKPPKKLMSGLLGSFRKGRSKDKVADNDPTKNPSSFEITVKEQPEEESHNEMIRTEGIVYAELDMARSPGSIMRKDDEKTEYAEIIYPGSKLTVERAAAELRKSRENLTSSRENLAEVDEAYSTTGEGKKEAAV